MGPMRIVFTSVNHEGADLPERDVSGPKLRDLKG